MSILEKIILDEEIFEQDLIDELYMICQDIHSDCYDACPVFKRMTDKEKADTLDGNCDHFVDGKSMLTYIKQKG